MLSTTRWVPWEAFALFPQEICNEPRFQQCVDEAGAASNLLVFEAKRVACDFILHHTIPVSALFFVGKAVKLGNEHRRSAGPGAVLEVDDEAL